jgi:multisubunit Na+/H+ antiporter MnhB subunit
MSEPEPVRVRRGFRLSRAQFIGVALTAVGILLLMLAYEAQASIDEIGDTNDPQLQERVTKLEDKRDAYMVSAIGALFMGLFAIAMLGEPSTPASLTQEQMISAARMNADVLAGLSLTGSAAYRRVEEDHHAPCRSI